MKEVFAKKGDRVTCTQGHLIATFAREVYKMEVVQTDMFADCHPQIDWRKNAILNGRCPEPGCDGLWIGAFDIDQLGALVSFSNKMYVEGEWR